MRIAMRLALFISILNLAGVLLTSMVALWICAAVINGIVLSLLWGWFIVPTFDVPALTLTPAIGIALVVSYLSGQETINKDSKYDLSVEIVYFVVKTLVLLIIGWVLHLFM